MSIGVFSSAFVAKVFTTSAFHVIAAIGFLDPEGAATTLFEFLALAKL